MLIKANGPLKTCIEADMLLRTDKKEKKRGHSLKEFFIKETQSYEYIFCIVCKNRQDVGFHYFIAFLDFSRFSFHFIRHQCSHLWLKKFKSFCNIEN